MAQPIYWGDRKLKGGWTDEEWDRLQKIKNGEYVPEVYSCKGATVTAAISPDLKKRVIRYAQERGLNPSQLIRETLIVLTE